MVIHIYHSMPSAAWVEDAQVPTTTSLDRRRTRAAPMRKSVEVIYENGVFRPLEPVELSEHQRMRVTLEEEADWLDIAYMEWCAREADDRVHLDAVRQALAKIPGSLTADFIAEREDR